MVIKSREYKAHFTFMALIPFKELFDHYFDGFEEKFCLLLFYGLKLLVLTLSPR